MTFTKPGQSKTDVKVKIGKTELPVVMEFKFLGTWLDKHLNWQKHVNNVIVKIK